MCCWMLKLSCGTESLAVSSHLSGIDDDVLVYSNDDDDIAVDGCDMIDSVLDVDSGDDECWL